MYVVVHAVRFKIWYQNDGKFKPRKMFLPLRKAIDSLRDITHLEQYK